MVCHKDMYSELISPIKEAAGMTSRKKKERNDKQKKKTANSNMSKKMKYLISKYQKRK